MYYFTFNGLSSRDLGVAVTTRPAIPAPQMRGDYIDIAGRDGSLLQTDGTYENIEIEIEINYIRPPHEWGDTYRRIKSWLKGAGVLRLSDDPDVFYKVIACGVNGVERRGKWGQELEAVFVCEPFQYLNSGTKEMTAQEASLNPYHTAKPIYKITGTGTARLTVNGNVMTALVGGNLTIDTDLMIAWRDNGIAENTSVTGDYAGLWLNNGVNTIAISSGFNLVVIPNYRSI